MKNPIFSMVRTLMFSLLLISLGQTQAAPVSPSYELGEQAYSGEDYFRAVMFARGTLAQKIPQLRNVSLDGVLNSRQQKARMIAMENRIIKEIRLQKGPRYFETFKKVMTSGNRPRIKATLDQAIALVRSVVAKLTGYRDGQAFQQKMAGMIKRKMAGRPLSQAVMSDIQKDPAIRKAMSNHARGLNLKSPDGVGGTADAVVDVEVAIYAVAVAGIFVFVAAVIPPMFS
ncbi:MAG: hypothetical protein AAF206_04915, partial [Bacteroidota bacterium]